ncbi:MAG: FUSC family protein [Clostridium sp.]
MFQKVLQKIHQSLPVILFFLILFYLIFILFGLPYIILATIVAIQFQIHSKKNLSLSKIISFILTQFVIQILAFLATRNIYNSIILNLIVPFWLIFTRSSQFNPTGYFSELMAFTFLQLMPVSNENFHIQIEAMALGMFLFFIAMIWYNKKFHKHNPIIQIKKQSFSLLNEAYQKQKNGNDIKQELQDLYQLQQAFYEEASNKRKASYIVSNEGKISYLYALLIQRTIYLLSHLSLSEEEHEDELQHLFSLLKKASENSHISSLINEIQAITKEENNKTDWIDDSIDSILSVLELILRNSLDHNTKTLDKKWKIPLSIRIKQLFHYRIRLDAFELRFAFRMSIILIIGMACNLYTNMEHGFWFVMNSFLLTQPMYEESIQRMKTRFIGTICGSLLMVLLQSLLIGIPAHMAIASILTFGVFSLKPGTSLHTFFVTGFSLTITSLALNIYIAVQLRILYVLVSIIFVLIVNKAIFPTSHQTQLKYNEQLIFHMHHVYLRILHRCLSSEADYWLLCDARIRFHLVYEQMKKEIEKSPDIASIDDEILHISYQMFSELEQLLFMITNRNLNTQLYDILSSYIHHADMMLNTIQEQLYTNHIIDKIYEYPQQNLSFEGFNYQLSQLMSRYSNHLAQLYKKVCINE